MKDPREIAYEIFCKMKEGEILLIAELAPKRPGLFIQFGRDFIVGGGNIIFSENETKITKTTPIEDAPAAAVKRIRPDLLELHTAHTAAEVAGLLDDHPQRELIGELWRGVLKHYHTPQLENYIDQLKQIKI